MAIMVGTIMIIMIMIILMTVRMSPLVYGNLWQRSLKQ